MTGVRLGRQAKFYLNVATYASPSWSEVPYVSDLTRNGEWDEAEASTRESAVKMTRKTLADISVGGKMKFVLGDANLTTILDAFYSPDSEIDIMVLNASSTTSGAYGVRYVCQVGSDTEDQGLGAAIFEDLKFMPTPSASGGPCSVKVVAGAPVFTLI